MATAYPIASAFWGPAGAIPHLHTNNALYVRLFENYYESNPGTFSVWKSSDAGVTWSMVGSPKTAFYNAVPGVGRVQGSVLYIPFFIYEAPFTLNTQRIAMARFDMDTDSWLSDWTGGPTAVDFVHHIDCAVRSDGSSIVIYSDADLSDRQIAYVPLSSSGTWGTKVTVTDFAQTDATYLSALADSTDHIHLFWGDTTGTVDPDNRTALKHRRLDTSNAVTHSSTIFANTSYPIHVGLETGNGSGCQSAALVTIGGVESVAIPLMVHPPLPSTFSDSGLACSPASGSSFTFTAVGAVPVERQQCVAAIGTTAYIGYGGDVSLSPDFSLVEQITYDGATDTFGSPADIHDGTTEWWQFAANALGANGIGYVLEHRTDGRAWFLRYSVAAGATILVDSIASTLLFGTPTVGTALLVANRWYAV
jgi:hypothetical protein